MLLAEIEIYKHAFGLGGHPTGPVSPGHWHTHDGGLFSLQL